MHPLKSMTLLWWEGCNCHIFMTSMHMIQPRKVIVSSRIKVQPHALTHDQKRDMQYIMQQHSTTLETSNDSYQQYTTQFTYWWLQDWSIAGQHTWSTSNALSLPLLSKSKLDVFHNLCQSNTGQNLPTKCAPHLEKTKGLLIVVGKCSPAIWALISMWPPPDWYWFHMQQPE